MLHHARALVAHSFPCMRPVLSTLETVALLTQRLCHLVVIEDNSPVDRVIAVPLEPEFLFAGYFNIRSVRPRPLYGVPGMVDHFLCHYRH